MTRATLASPIDMVLHCPECGLQHIDAPDSAFSKEPVSSDTMARAIQNGYWTNPPHRSHLCAGCGHIWRPADVATNGVEAVKTKGRDDDPIGAVSGNRWKANSPNLWRSARIVDPNALTWPDDGDTTLTK